jgi:hypothetical protein
MRLCRYGTGEILLQHPSKWIPHEERVSSFNPLYRMSSEALSFIHEALLDGAKVDLLIVIKDMRLIQRIWHGSAKSIQSQ